MAGPVREVPGPAPKSGEGAGMLLSSLAHLRSGTGGELHNPKLQPGERDGAGWARPGSFGGRLDLRAER